MQFDRYIFLSREANINVNCHLSIASHTERTVYQCLSEFIMQGKLRFQHLQVGIFGKAALTVMSKLTEESDDVAIQISNLMLTLDNNVSTLTTQPSTSLQKKLSFNIFLIDSIDELKYLKNMIQDWVSEGKLIWVLIGGGLRNNGRHLSIIKNAPQLGFRASGVCLFEDKQSVKNHISQLLKTMHLFSANENEIKFLAVKKSALYALLGNRLGKDITNYLSAYLSISDIVHILNTSKKFSQCQADNTTAIRDAFVHFPVKNCP